MNPDNTTLTPYAQCATIGPGLSDSRCAFPPWWTRSKVRHMNDFLTVNLALDALKGRQYQLVINGQTVGGESDFDMARARAVELVEEHGQDCEIVRNGSTIEVVR